MLKISFCTVCMNRIEHLKKTLPVNIHQNLDYPALQHILLDYNSGDCLDKWIMENFMKFIRSGNLIYYKTNNPAVFHRSHSRNMAFSMADDGIVCNIDADNYSGKGFARFLNNHFQRHPNSFLSVDYNNSEKKYRDSYGRIACLKKDFQAVGGFDEKMSGYGYEDIDFCERLKRYGLKQKYIRRKNFLHSIRHSDALRLANETRQSQFGSVYIQYLTPFKSSIIYLFTDQTFSMATLNDSQEGFGIPSLEQKKWIEGLWDRHKEKLILQPNKITGESFSILPNNDLLDSKNSIYYLITNKKFREQLKMYYSIITNHQHYLNNKNRNVIAITYKKFGSGTVIRNFDEKIVYNHVFP